MERRFEVRMEELLEDAVLDPRIPEGMLDRLERFVKPFAAIMESPEQQRHLWEYVAGLFSDVKRKNAETIAYFHDQDRQALQKFIGQSLWDDGLLIEELSRQVGRELGESDGVLVFDPSAFRKQGKESVGVARQWCGRFGKIDNCQVGIYLGYVSRKEHALVDVRLYLNKDWAKDKRRRKKCGVPERDSFPDAACPGPGDAGRTRDSVASRLDCGRRRNGAQLGISPGFAGVWESGICWRCRRTLWCAIWKHEPPEYGGRGPRPQVPFMRVDRWREALPEDAWTTIDVRDGARGPLVVQAVKTRVQAKTDRRRNGPEEIAGGSAGRAERWNDEARLLSLERLARNGSGRVCPRGQSRASDRGVPRAGQERCGAGPVSGSQLDRLASPSNAFAVGGVVPDARRPAGEKNTLRL